MEQFRDGQHPIVIFTDGACSGNPGPGGWGAIICTPDGQVTELGAGEKATTNNRMELTGSIRALEAIGDRAGEVNLYTDSTYVIRGITQWVWGWRQRDWINSAGEPVANKDLWERLVRVAAARRGAGKLNWLYVRGHTGVPGNERVDEIAVEFTQGRRPKLYNGKLVQYPVAIMDLPVNGELPPPKPKTAAKAAAFSYLSLVDGVARRHKTWPECERRVKGVSGARFKKAMSEAEEAEILDGWGARVAD